MIKFFVQILIMFSVSSNAVAGYNCDSWKNDTPEMVSNTGTLEEFAGLVGELTNCSGARADSTPDDRKRYDIVGNPEALKCYSELGLSMHINKNELTDDVLEAEEKVSASKCVESGDKEMDHLFALLKIYAKKFADQRRPLAEAEKQKAAEAQAKHDIEIKKQEAKQSSKACRVATEKQNFCGAMNVVKLNELVIAHEKKVGRQSGFVNALKLRNATSNKINMEQAAAEARKKYRTASGKDISVSSCGIVVEGNMETRLPASIDAQVEKDCGE